MGRGVCILSFGSGRRGRLVCCSFLVLGGGRKVLVSWSMELPCFKGVFLWDLSCWRMRNEVAA